jgi:hypothetical protein
VPESPWRALDGLSASLVPGRRAFLSQLSDGIQVCDSCWIRGVGRDVHACLNDAPLIRMYRDCGGGDMKQFTKRVSLLKS